MHDGGFNVEHCSNVRMAKPSEESESEINIREDFIPHRRFPPFVEKPFDW
ncbi:MAG: hypothetical protein ACTS6P_00780 [Candidatus Hodgkinia cicadicola]